MLRYRDIRQLQQILLLRRLIANLLVLRYVQALKGADTYNAGNQLISENGVSYAYDKNGNLINKTTSEGTTTYFYDYENILIKAVMPNGTVAEFKYDPFGRRIEKKVTESGATTIKRYFYDNEDILFEYDDNGVISNRYIHGLGIDEPLALTTNQGTYYYHVDGLGSVVALTDSSAKVVQDYQYDSFGNLKDQKNRIKQLYTYTGREYDQETGLYYYRARYYDPIIGRFTSKDPIMNSPKQRGLRSRACAQDNKYKLLSLLQAEPERLNFYVYVSNNAQNLVDPYGLIDIKSKLSGEIIADILEMAIGEIISKTTGAACASRYCKRNAFPKEETDAVAECMSIFDKYDIPTGVPPVTSSDEYVDACGTECYRITRTKEFKKLCCPK